MNRTIVVKGKVGDDVLEQVKKLVDGFKEVAATYSSTNVVVEEDVWGACKVLREGGCEIEAIHVSARKVSTHLSL